MSTLLLKNAHVVLTMDSARREIRDEAAHACLPRTHPVRVIDAIVQAAETGAGDADAVAEMVREAAAGLVPVLDRGEQRGMLSSGQPRRVIHRLMVRPSKKLKARINS